MRGTPAARVACLLIAFLACVDAQPSVLKSFQVFVIDDKSIFVDWEPWSPEKGENIVVDPDGYIVQFKEGAANSWNRTDIILDTGNDHLSAYITDLKPNTEYSVQVSGVSGHVNSQTTRTERVMTQCGVPLSSPSNFSHKETTDGMLKVTWQLPERSQWQCAEVSVEVQIDDGAPQDSTRTTVFTFRTKPFTTFRIHARLKTSRGVGPWSDLYKFTTPEEAVANGILRRYHLLLVVHGLDGVRCHVFRAPDMINVSYPANVTSAVFHNLTASAVYNVSIRATTVKDGPWKEYRLNTSEEVPEAAPQPLTATVRDRKAVALWNRPDCTKVNGRVTAYHFLRTSTAKWASNELSTKLRDTALEMFDLVPFTEYNITVSAENSAGVGPTAELSFRTAPSAPPAPTNLNAYSASSERLALSWLPPYPPYGRLERYTVRYTPANESVFRYNLELAPEQATCDGDADARSGHHCAVLEALVPKMKYLVIVNAKNKDVDTWSVRSNLVTVETRDSKPGPPSYITVSKRDETEVIISWKEPTFHNGYILGYRVTLKNQQLLAAESNISMEVPAERRQAHFSNLTPGTAYVAQVEARTSAGYGEAVEISVHTRPRLRREERGGSGSTTVAVVVTVVILIVVLIVVAWKWRKRIVGTGSKAEERLHVMDNENGGPELDMTELGGSVTLAITKPVAVSDLQDYVQRMLASDGLKSEFNSQPKRLQYSTSEAQTSENKAKNRHGNLLPYDHNRVRLKPMPGVSLSSDYINASYVDGYGRPRRYITAQGPKRHTVNSFWHMVWQEKVCKIVMLSGLVENGQTKCERYWPSKAKANYGKVHVRLVAQEVFPGYNVHQLHVTLGDTTREVTHFHLTSWPDHGVPLYPNTVLTFRRKVNQYKTLNEAPVLVHGSVGVGRTGAYILLDNLIEQARTEGFVDVTDQLAALRQSRMNAVETLEQYNFVHRALVESLYIRDHSIPCSEFLDRCRELISADEARGKSNTAKEFEVRKREEKCPFF
ncbi:hypothetical protein MTO96_032946 [Rhipicephalus appendiculatus]